MSLVCVCVCVCVCVWSPSHASDIFVWGSPSGMFCGGRALLPKETHCLRNLAARTEWRRLIWCLNLQVISRKRATNYRALWRKMTYKDVAPYDSTPPCTKVWSLLNTRDHFLWGSPSGIFCGDRALLPKETHYLRTLFPLRRVPINYHCNTPAIFFCGGRLQEFSVGVAPFSATPDVYGGPHRRISRVCYSEKIRHGSGVF